MYYDCHLPYIDQRAMNIAEMYKNKRKNKKRKNKKKVTHIKPKIGCIGYVTRVATMRNNTHNFYVHTKFFMFIYTNERRRTYICSLYDLYFYFIWHIYIWTTTKHTRHIANPLSLSLSMSIWCCFQYWKITCAVCFSYPLFRRCA